MRVLTKTILMAVCLLAGRGLCLGGTTTAQETPFDMLIERLGLADNVIDFSDTNIVIIDKPTCAYINITGTDEMPKSKTDILNVCMDIFTDDGNHFLKRAIISAQGNSSLYFPKKNFKADFCEDQWKGEKTTSFTIGEWVKQDAFHFNSYYVDYLRGIGVVCYQLYDQIAQNSGRPWTRALGDIAKPKENARCYPDGFPCIVYLNGDFYGIFAWQLKKHRDNMNMKKKEAMHIHLDGKIGNDTFWGHENIEWNQFEVRNPKKLYTMDGQVYDGDNPQELIDETSKFYLIENDDETTKAAKERTAQVKHCIEALASYYAEVENMQKAKRNRDEIRSFIEEHFDMTSMIDYACFHFVVNNYDGFRNNWQWFTYDGKKWFVTPYDLDNTFGNCYSEVTPPEKVWTGGGAPWQLFSIFGPFYWMPSYFAEEMEDRYFELRDARIIDSANIIGLLQKWHHSIRDFYANEWRRWPESMCITAYHDSLERYEEWITQRIKIMDGHFGYNSSDFQLVTSPVKDNSQIAIYNMAGHRLHSPLKGLNVYRYGNGSVKKVIR